MGKVIFDMSVSLDGFVTAVAIMGGPDLGRQYLVKGLLDEIGVHVAPVLFGAGTPMFGDLGGGHIGLEVVEVLPTSSATHLRYRIV